MSELFPINRAKKSIDDQDSLEMELPDSYSEPNKVLCTKYQIGVLLLSCLFYYMSLEGCHNTQSHCITNVTPFFIARVCCSLVLSSILFYANIINFFKARNFVLLAAQLTSFYCLFLYDQGTDLAHHGEYNKLFCIGFILLFAIIHLFIFVFRTLYRQNFMVFLLVILLFTVILTKLVYNLKFKTCQNYNVGLFGKEPEKDIKCDFMVPGTCWMDFLDNKMDIPKLTGQSCNIDTIKEEAIWKEYLSEELSNAKRICLPRTQNFNFFKEGLLEHFQKEVFNQIVDLDKSPQECEQQIVFSEEGTKLIYDLKRDEKLAEKRGETNNPNKKVKNIIFIYVDAISRRHFHRKMKKTAAFFEKNTQFKTVEFFKHQSLDFFTQININALFYGDSMWNKSGTSIFNFAQEKGFITVASQEHCGIDLYDIEPGFIENLTYVPQDYENKSFNCDPNYHKPESPFSPFLGPYSIYKRCLHGKEVFDYTLEYAEQLINLYESESKFVRIASIMAHEPTGELPKYLDEKIASFLERMKEKGVFENTALVLQSDHGNNMAGPYFILGAEDHLLEKTVSTAFIMLPTHHGLTADQVKNFEKNGSKYTTHYDTFNTLLYLMGEERELFGKDKYHLFDELPSRDCELLKGEMELKWCRCQKSHGNIN